MRCDKVDLTHVVVHKSATVSAERPSTSNASELTSIATSGRKAGRLLARRAAAHTIGGGARIEVRRQMFNLGNASLEQNN